MRGYSIWRPLMVIAVALLTNTLVSNLGVLLGMSKESAGNIAVLAMLIAAFVMVSRIKKPRRK